MEVAIDVQFRIGARSSIFDPLRIDPVKLSVIQWHSTSSLQQVLAQTDLYNPRYRNFSTDNLKQVVINFNKFDMQECPKRHVFVIKSVIKTML